MSTTIDNKEFLSHISRETGQKYELFAFDVIDSTNSEARRYAISERKAPAIFIANTQTSGRGRMGRSFYSPKDTGLYLSLLLPLTQTDALRLTTYAAVAVRRSIYNVCGVSTDIKWVNDLYLGRKKVSGILAEALTVNGVHMVILGIGINLNTEKFPEELAGIAGAVGVDPDIRPLLASSIICELYSMLFREESSSVMREYREHSAVIGKDIVFCENGIWFSGKAEDITDCGHLCVRLVDGERRTLSSGEISLRVKN